LLLDNASSHNAENIPTLSNIKVHFLPPNTTSILQPLDQGIIYSLINNLSINERHVDQFHIKSWY
jgi:hypothetical protein